MWGSHYQWEQRVFYLLLCHVFVDWNGGTLHKSHIVLLLRSSRPPPPPPSQLQERGGGSGTQQFAYQERPDKIFAPVKFVSSHDGHFGPEGGCGGGSRGGGGLTPLLLWCTAILILPIGGEGGCC